MEATDTLLLCLKNCLVTFEGVGTFGEVGGEVVAFCGPCAIPMLLPCIVIVLNRNQVHFPCLLYLNALAERKVHPDWEASNSAPVMHRECLNAVQI